MEKGIGDQFQQETKYFRGKLAGGYLDWSKRPEPFKAFPAAQRIALPPPEREEGASLWAAVQGRRSRRDFRPEPLRLEALSQLLWASQGITGVSEGFKFRATPSAGALYPIETYIVSQNIAGLEPGLFHYGVARHELEIIRQSDLREEIATAALDQDFIRDAGVVFVWTAVFERMKWKYKQRAYRYIYLDAGHIAQNLALAAVALGLGSCQVAAFYDNEINAILGVDGENESAIFLTAVGIPL
jgi:SagB-type dehydrogenase family enzyme